MTARRCLFWVQSLLGSGHLRRALLAAEALAARGVAVTLANGGLPPPWAVREGVELVQLPPLIVKGMDFAHLVEPDGTSASPALHEERRRRLLTLLEETAPDVLITEMFPFGRRGFRGELLPLLEAARARTVRPLIVASVRDVLVSKPDPRRYGWMVEICLAYYDRVLVHGDERLLPFAASFPLAERLGDRVVHTGYVVPPPIPALAEPGPIPAVLVSAGGGAVGDRLLPTALAARRHSRLGSAPWLLVGGQNLPEAALAELATATDRDVNLVRFRPDLPALMAAAEVSVSQAGYNTVAEGLALGARMVLVPFAADGEDEQTRRAERLAELGLVETVAETALTPETLAAAIDRAATKPRPAVPAWAFDGAARTAELLLAEIQDRRR